MKSCRQKALCYNHKYVDNTSNINSMAKTYIISGMALWILITIVLIRENNLNINMNALNLLGIIELTIFNAAILLIIYGLVLKVRHETFNESIQVYEKNSLLNKMSKINSFASKLNQNNVSYYDVSENSNGLDLLLIHLMIACTYYSQNSTVFGVIVLLVSISCLIFIMTHCYPDRLNNYFKNDIRSNEGYKKFFIFAHITLFTTLIIVLLTFL